MQKVHIIIGDLQQQAKSMRTLVVHCTPTRIWKALLLKQFISKDTGQMAVSETNEH